MPILEGIQLLSEVKRKMLWQGVMHKPSLEQCIKDL